MTKSPFKKIAMKRGRPRKEVSQFKQLAEESATITFETLNEIANLKKDVETLMIKVASLKHQEIGYQAVINYLEHRLFNNERSSV